MHDVCTLNVARTCSLKNRSTRASSSQRRTWEQVREGRMGKSSSNSEQAYVVNSLQQQVQCNCSMVHAWHLPRRSC